jgi:hypothetical protein
MKSTQRTVKNHPRKNGKIKSNIKHDKTKIEFGKTEKHKFEFCGQNVKISCHI